MKVYYKRYFMVNKPMDILTKIRMENWLDKRWNSLAEAFNAHIEDWNKAYDAMSGRKPGEHVGADYNSYIAEMANDNIAVMFCNPGDRFFVYYTKPDADLSVVDKLTGAVGHFEFKEVKRL